jgi:hypothetical protein
LFCFDIPKIQCLLPDNGMAFCLQMYRDGSKGTESLGVRTRRPYMAEKQRGGSSEQHAKAGRQSHGGQQGQGGKQGSGSNREEAARKGGER